MAAGSIVSRIRIVHHTGYTYERGAKASFNEARMTPLATHEQQLLYARIEITPTAWQHAYTDYWGTQVLAFEVNELHSELSIVASSEVDIARDLTPRTNQLNFDELNDPEMQDRLTEYLEMAASTNVHPELAEWVRLQAEIAETPAGLARSIVDRVNSEIRYVTGVTHVTSSAAEAWEARAGVCQDMAHIALGALRMVGIPARYVSGYVLPVEDAPYGVPQHGESHAWVQFWDGDWVATDPSDSSRPDERYIEVAHGRDYFDVAPLTGVFSGGGTSEMFVNVELTLVG